MNSFAPDFPTAWSREELSHGSYVLLGHHNDSVHLLAPPGARIQIDEQDRSRACWRHAWWQESPELGPPAISIDDPVMVDDLCTAEVVELLPGSLHDFVRVEMARQLCRAETFGKPSDGERLTDRQARLAGRTRSWVTAELASAFPEEHWFELVEPKVDIPRTVDELLDRMPPGRELAEGGRRPQFGDVRVKLRHLQARAVSRSLFFLAGAFRLVGQRWDRTERLATRCDRRALRGDHGTLRDSELTR